MNSSDYERWVDLVDREAMGESLSDEDSAFLDRFSQVDPVARAERDCLASLGDWSVRPDDGTRALADAAVRTVLARGAARRRRAVLFAASGVVAAAAAFALLVLRHPDAAPAASVAVPVVPTARLEYAAGSVEVGGKAAQAGARVALGAEVKAVAAPACLELESRMHLCLASGSRAQLTAIGGRIRRVDLLEGRVAVALDPLPRGERLSIVARGVWSSAVGTAFTVAILPNGQTETVVHEGKVAVGAELGGNIVGLHRVGTASAAGVTEGALADHAATQTPEWLALARVSERPIEGEGAQGSGEEHAAVAPAEPAPVAPKRVLPSRPVPPAASEAPQVERSASDWLRIARQALRDHQWSSAASAYLALLAAAPGSAEAHTSLVSLANLEIDRLGEPMSGLAHAQQYLSTGGGPLASEAWLAQIRAYRKMGRSELEATSIDTFLSRFPGAMESADLRRRRAELGSP